MPFESINDERLEARLNLRLLSEEKIRIAEDADLAGLSMSELVRRRYFGRPIVADANLQMIRELRRIGGLLKHVHLQSDGAYSTETAAALAELRAYIRQLSTPK